MVTLSFTNDNPMNADKIKFFMTIDVHPRFVIQTNQKKLTPLNSTFNHYC